MRRAWLAAGYAAAWAIACSTTNNVTNVTNVEADGGDSDAASDASTAPADGGTQRDADVVADGAADADVDAATCTELQGATSTSCRVDVACPTCTGSGFIYVCAGGARPNLPHCTSVDAGVCCQAEWMRAPEDDGFCANPDFPKIYIGPTTDEGQPAIAVPDACVSRGKADGGRTWMMCCPANY